MIYFDNCATTLKKPPTVAKAVAQAIGTLGNAGRSFYAAAMQAGREVHRARQAVAALAMAKDPLCVAFTSSATESLNLVINALVAPQSHVITTVLEHNSVLRPLYRTRCALSVLDCDNAGRLRQNQLAGLLRPTTRFVFATHGSNVLGSVTDTARLYEFCKKHSLIFVLDVAQTFGQRETGANMADVLCFTGHKSLFGPQGTGGIIATGQLPFGVTKTGGSGANSFAKNQGMHMPEVFEAGSLNSHSLVGLRAGAEFVATVGVNAIQRKETELTTQFISGMQGIQGVSLYGPAAGEERLPVVALNIKGLSSEETALRLWEEYEIATRPGSHCVPLLHERMGTVRRGMVRFSFGYFNTPDEIETGIAAVQKIAETSA